MQLLKKPFKHLLYGELTISSPSIISTTFMFSNKLEFHPSVKILFKQIKCFAEMLGGENISNRINERPSPRINERPSPQISWTKSPY